MNQRQDFISRVGRASQGARSGLETIGRSQTKNQRRNQHLTEMLERYQGEAARGRSISTRGFKVPAFMTYLLAFAMGGLAALIAGVIRFQIAGAEVFGSADIDMVIDVAIAVAFAFLLREALSQSAVKNIGMQFAGILLAVVTMHNAVHEMPELFSHLFSEQWVQHVTDTTQPGTLYFRGQSYHI